MKEQDVADAADRRRLYKTLADAYLEIPSVEGRLARALEALRVLYDEQNGPPLLGPKQKYWDDAMIEAKAVLEEEGR